MLPQLFAFSCLHMLDTVPVKLAGIEGQAVDRGSHLNTSQHPLFEFNSSVSTFTQHEKA
jgi:hypothetical protein